jgi:hypothetical protein
VSVSKREKRRAIVVLVSVALAALLTVAGFDWLYAGFAFGLIVGIYAGNEAR